MSYVDPKDHFRTEKIEETRVNVFEQQKKKYYSHSERHVPRLANASVVLTRWPGIPSSDFSNPARPPTPTDETGYVGFTPVHLPTDHFVDILRWHLKPPINAVCDSNGAMVWVVDPETEGLIKHLDLLFRYTLQSLRHGVPENVITRLQRPWARFPSAYLHSTRYVDSREAVIAVNNARRAFYPIFAILSYTVARYPYNGGYPGWITVLEEEKHDPNWIDALRSSSLLDFSGSVQRVGAIFSLCNAIQVSDYELYFKRRVPVWFRGDQWQITWMKSAQAKHTPEFDMKRDMALLRPLEQTNLILEGVGDDSELPSGYPLERDSGQLPLETPIRFFDRRSFIDSRMFESEAERDKRQARELQFDRIGIAGFNGSLFVWEIWHDENGAGHWVRRRAHKRRLRLLWEQYGTQGTRYDSYSDSIDFWQEETPEPEEADISFIDREMGFEVDFIGVDLTEARRGEIVGDVLWNSVEEKFIRSMFRDVRRTMETTFDTPVGLAAMRFGYKARHIDSNTNYSPDDVTKALRQLGCHTSELHDQDIGQRLAHCALDWIPKRGLHSRQKLLKWLSGTSFMRTKFVTSYGNWYAVIDPSNPSESVCTSSATVFIEILRRLKFQQTPALGTLTRELTRAGLPFSTAKQVSTASRSCFRATPIPDSTQRTEEVTTTGLGYRPLLWQCGIDDYEAYWHQVIRLMESPGARRAAGMSGGIIWRLAVQAVNTDFLAREVMKGPTVTATEHDLYCSYIEPDSSGVFWKDDALSREDQDIICGVYQVPTGVNAAQCAAKSWWPRQNIWLRVVGTGWNGVAEEWFNRHLREIEEQTASIHNSSDWRNQLKRLSGAKKLESELEVISKKILDEEL